MAAAKGNKYALGNSGRSKVWKDAKSMQKAIVDYFSRCDEEKQPKTIEGLAIALYFDDTDSLLNYEKKEGYEEFFGTIKRAKLIIKEDKVSGMLSNKYNATGAIFDLKNNHGYVDKRVHAGDKDNPIQTENKNTNSDINFSDLPDELQAQILAHKLSDENK